MSLFHVMQYMLQLATVILVLNISGSHVACADLGQLNSHVSAFEVLDYDLSSIDKQHSERSARQKRFASFQNDLHRDSGVLYSDHNINDGQVTLNIIAFNR